MICNMYLRRRLIRYDIWAWEQLFSFCAFCCEKGMDGSGWSEGAFEAASLNLFLYITLMMSTRLWRRQFILYKSYPWRLLQIIDTDIHEDDRKKEAQAFLDAKECCLDEGFSLRLQKMGRSVDDFLSGGALHELLVLLSFQKPLNAEIEDNFARHHSCAKSARGTFAVCIRETFVLNE